MYLESGMMLRYVLHYHSASHELSCLFLEALLPSAQPSTVSFDSKDGQLGSLRHPWTCLLFYLQE